MLQYVGNAAYYSFVPSLEEGSFSVSSCSTVLSADLSTMLVYQSPRAQRFFILTKRGRERLVRLMADENGRENATGSGTKVSKRKLKRLQVSRSSWFILLVKGMSLFSHLQRICVVRFHTKSTANPGPLLSHNSKQPPFSLRKFSWLSSHGTTEFLEAKVIYVMLGMDLSCKHCLLVRALYWTMHTTYLFHLACFS